MADADVVERGTAGLVRTVAGTAALLVDPDVAACLPNDYQRAVCARWISVRQSDQSPSDTLERAYKAARADGDRDVGEMLWKAWFRARCAEGKCPDALRRDSGTPTERFWACTVDGPDGHLFWDGARKNGKPVTHRGVGYRQILAARFAWILKHGPIASNYTVYATCGEENCLNVEHLTAAHAPSLRRAYRHEALIGALQACAMKLGQTPTSKEYDLWRGKSGRGRRSVPTSDSLIERLGSWRKALSAAGLGEPRRYVRPVLNSDEAIVAALRAWTDEHGRPPTSHVWKEHKLRPSATTIGQRWGSWAAALERAGLA